ncbi:MAG TPA: bacillithiol system redox-active protein YtxJ [Thermomicrobiales bacterium]|nr:bacillithiol system redox-active protein YtxJ [Thermomicrobiales bacterium]
MTESFPRIETIDELDAAFARSRENPVVLFNHDPWCPISARAFRALAQQPHPLSLIDVSRRRDITLELARRTGVRHESPQVIVVHDGAARWAASHFAITAGDVDAAVRGVSASEHRD